MSIIITGVWNSQLWSFKITDIHCLAWQINLLMNDKSSIVSWNFIWCQPFILILKERKEEFSSTKTWTGNCTAVVLWARGTRWTKGLEWRRRPVVVFTRRKPCRRRTVLTIPTGTGRKCTPRRKRGARTRSRSRASLSGGMLFLRSRPRRQWCRVPATAVRPRGLAAGGPSTTSAAKAGDRIATTATAGAPRHY